MRKRILSTIIIALLVMFLMVNCSAINIAGTSTPLPQTATPALEDNTVSASGEVVPAKWVNLSFPSGGQNLQIRVTPCQLVTQDFLLATIDDLSAVAGQENANLQLANAQANLQRLEDAKAADQDITAAEAAITAAEANLNLAKQALDNTKLLSPFSGFILDINGHNGEIVAPGQPLITMADYSTLQIQTTDMSEVDAVRIQKGDPADISFDALPNKSVTGRVVQIALKKSAGSGVYYTITIALDTIPDDLRWGMSAFAEIKVK